jgi:opacity protein-like surface antigen
MKSFRMLLATLMIVPILFPLCLLASVRADDTTDSDSFSASETEMGAGVFTGVSIPFGWFDDRGLNSTFIIGGHFLYSLESLVPDLKGRATILYESFDGDRINGYRYSFRDVNMFVDGLYYFDIGLPMKPYALAGVGLNFVELNWDYEYYHTRNSSSTNTVGLGILLGGGAEFKATDTVSVFTEVNMQTSSWASGAGYTDFIFRLLLGVTVNF